MRLPVLLSLFIIASAGSATAQNAYLKLGQQALWAGDFRAAIRHLERACLADSTNSDAQWMLGYSYYHSENYKKSIAAYSRVIAVKPADASAYYYRARAKSYMAKDIQLNSVEKEKCLLGAISDFTKALLIKPSDFKIYQNRGIAYRDYGTFKLQANTKAYDKGRGISALKASIADLEKALNEDPSRADLESLLELSKEKLATAQGHH